MHVFINPISYYFNSSFYHTSYRIPHNDVVVFVTKAYVLMAASAGSKLSSYSINVEWLPPIKADKSDGR